MGNSSGATFRLSPEGSRLHYKHTLHSLLKHWLPVEAIVSTLVLPYLEIERQFLGTCVQTCARATIFGRFFDHGEKIPLITDNFHRVVWPERLQGRQVASKTDILLQSDHPSWPSLYIGKWQICDVLKDLVLAKNFRSVIVWSTQVGAIVNTREMDRFVGFGRFVTSSSVVVLSNCMFTHWDFVNNIVLWTCSLGTLSFPATLVNCRSREQSVILASANSVCSLALPGGHLSSFSIPNHLVPVPRSLARQSNFTVCREINYDHAWELVLFNYETRIISRPLTKQYECEWTFVGDHHFAFEHNADVHVIELSSPHFPLVAVLRNVRLLHGFELDRGRLAVQDGPNILFYE